MAEIYLNKLNELINIIKSNKKNKILVAELAPAVRVTIGEYYGYSAGEDLTKKTIGLLKKLGFDYIIDTPLGADLVVYEEIYNFKKILDKNDLSYFPIFNSCCIGWKMYCKRIHPELIPHVSNIASPNQIVGSIAKNYLAKKINKRPEDIIVVGIMPCTLKKFETIDTIKNSELKFVDFVITTEELVQWAKYENLHLQDIEDEEFTEFLKSSSREGLIFGATGGVTESFLTAFAKYVDKEKEIVDFRNDDEIKTKTVQIGKYKINVAIVFGLNNLEKILERIENGKFFHFIEVMQCPFGCVGGPGQPKASSSIIQERAKALRNSAENKSERYVQDNPTLKQIYVDLNLIPNSKETKKLFYH